MTIEATCLSYPDALSLTDWYEREHRKLPWRESRDPYAIWISETMLQQTRVETVIPYYHAFMDRYPSVQDLASADFDEVAKLWQGLGYYSRARNLHRAAQVLVSEYGGIMPKTEEDVRSLPGIGPYTTGAVLSIAYDLPVPAVDGNVLRVMTRYLGIYEPIENNAVKQAVTQKVKSWLTVTQPSVLTQAVMELGAMVCTPKSPDCALCPLREGCHAFGAGTQSKLPMRKPKQAKRIVNVYALWLEHDGFVCMHKRPDKGLLAGMWEFPAIEYPVTEASPKDGKKPPGKNKPLDTEVVPAGVETSLTELLGRLTQSASAERTVQQLKEQSVVRERSDRDEFDLGADGASALRQFAKVAEERHLFTHIDWTVQVLRPVGTTALDYQLDTVDKGLTDEYAWVPKRELHKLVLPRVYEKLVEVLVQDT